MKEISTFNLLLADSIYFTHIVIIIFMITAPFTNSLSILILHLTFTISLLLHWKMNSNVCCLSYTEAYLRGTSINETFMNKFIEPVYNISDYQLNKVIWISTIILGLITAYKIYNHENISKLLKCSSFQECAILLK